MLAPCPKGWTRHASAFDITLCLLIAQDTLIRAGNYAVLDWMVGLLDEECALNTIPRNLTAAEALVSASLETPRAPDLWLVFSVGPCAAYDRVSAEEQAGEAAAAAVLWDWPVEMEEC